LAKELGHNAHRFSIEWSRIEPEEGKFSEREIGHYVDAILALRQRNLEPIVTLHHFTNPLWFSQKGGWQNRKAAQYFSLYVSRVVDALCDKVSYWVTINEPMVYIYQSYILGLWPPQEKSLLKARRARDNFINAHVQAYKIIHSIYKNRGLVVPSVSIAKNLQAFVPCSHNLKNNLATFLRDRYFNFKFIESLIRHKALDFIGINYYTRSLIDIEKWGLKNLLLETCKRNHSQLQKNYLGWDIYPEGLYSLLLRFKRFNLPIFILENGICTCSDNARWDFIREHLKNIHAAMAEGVRVIGYIYWSLIDNYEWDKGFAPRFGLIEVDYNTYKRTVRGSAKKLSLVFKTGRLDTFGN
jgi:beta-glucosidase